MIITLQRYVDFCCTTMQISKCFCFCCCAFAIKSTFLTGLQFGRKILFVTYLNDLLNSKQLITHAKSQVLLKKHDETASRKYKNSRLKVQNFFPYS